ncbi:50S ribosomal protein L29 [Patescibacteria group bacterium]|nr:50S ribosomal protein L29 [Patescibacteria group bacterium]MBU1683462.1 50S ribosomal protein L29 [Patescibacteria group bacterium]MBU1934635.1 50S ribosomal protein L29 [Patescibacteria group bacterium]
MLSIQELRSSTKKELLKELESARTEMVRVRIGVKTKHLKDSTFVSKHKKYIAQIKTILKELDLEEMIEKATNI